MTDNSALIAAARVQYEKVQDAALAATPLANMPSWVQSGKLPPASSLRQIGFTSDCADENRVAHLRLARMAFTRKWGFSIPCAEAIDQISKLSPIVEVGAGSGYWTAMLRAAGIDIIATDALPAGKNPHGFQTSEFCKVEPIDALSAVTRYENRSIFCSWPTEGEEWAAEAFSKLPRGNHLILIGTGRGGITGSNSLFDLIDSELTLLNTIEIPQFPKVKDLMWIYVR